MSSGAAPGSESITAWMNRRTVIKPPCAWCTARTNDLRCRVLGSARAAFSEEKFMIAHTTLPVSDYRRSKTFYTKVLEPLGYRNNMEYGEAAGFNDGENTDFWIAVHKSIVPLHLAFTAKSAVEVQSFHRAALAAGARDNGSPGYRDYWPGYYAAFAYDPDGHNIEAVWYDYSKVKP